MSFPGSVRRVEMLFERLFYRDPTGRSWLSSLWALGTRQPVAVTPPHEFGDLIFEEVVAVGARGRRVGFDRSLPPSAAFLRWLLRNPERMTPPPGFGTADAVVAAKRRALVAGNPIVRREALDDLDRRGAAGSEGAWWAFEGFTRMDCCLMTGHVVLCVEAKQTEAVCPSTHWYPARRQLWRNVEVARELAGDRDYGAILVVDSQEAGLTALILALASLEDSFPHLSHDDRTTLSRHLLGFVTLDELQQEFGVSATEG